MGFKGIYITRTCFRDERNRGEVCDVYVLRDSIVNLLIKQRGAYWSNGRVPDCDHAGGLNLLMQSCVLEQDKPQQYCLIPMKRCLHLDMTEK